MNDELLLLDRTTGLVHQYDVGNLSRSSLDLAGLNGSYDSDGNIACDCSEESGNMLETALRNSETMIITEEHLEVGIWEKAPCLEDGKEV
mgnify:CR=1 FL=1